MQYSKTEDLTDAGQNESMQDRVMQDKTDAVQDRFRTGQMQVQARCKTGLKQERSKAVE